MHLKALLAAAAILSSICGRAEAAPTITGNDMLPACEHLIDDENESGLFKQGECIGLVIGVGVGAGVCVPPDATDGQAVRVMLDYMHKNPSRLNLQFTALVQASLLGAWPCSSPK